MKIFGGNINADGTIHLADGNDDKTSTTAFSVARAQNSPGIYDITFTTPFAACPVVLCKVNLNGWSKFTKTDGSTASNALVVAVDKEKCRIMTGVGFPQITKTIAPLPNVTTDLNFSFIVISTDPTDTADPTMPSNAVAGLVLANGNPRCGQSSQFDCLRVDKGAYILLLKTTPSTGYAPVVVAVPYLYINPIAPPIQQPTSETTCNAITAASDKFLAMIQTGDGEGNHADLNFAFLAYFPDSETDASPPAAIQTNDDVSTIGAVAGNVNSSEDTHSGTGFQAHNASPHSNGQFTMTFDPPLTNNPVYLICQNYLNWLEFSEISQTTGNNAVISLAAPLDQTTPYVATILTGNTNGMGEDRNFGFLCVDLPTYGA